MVTMKETVELSVSGWMVVEESAQMPATSHLIDEPAVDKEGDDRQKDRLTKTRAPPLLRHILQQGLRDPAERDNRRDQGETDGRVRKVDFSAYFSVSMMRGSSAPDGDQIASLVLRCFPASRRRLRLRGCLRDFRRQSPRADSLPQIFQFRVPARTNVYSHCDCLQFFLAS
jgi:hypothetical protein